MLTVDAVHEVKRNKEAALQRVKVVKKPDLHGTGKGSGPCRCKGQTGVVQTVFPDGLAIIRLDQGGRVGIPYGCLKDIK